MLLRRLSVRCTRLLHLSFSFVAIVACVSTITTTPSLLLKIFNLLLFNIYTFANIRFNI